jgi:GT2 family glycosyltransferase
VSVAAVVGSYRSAHLLPECVASLHAQQPPLAEIVVVDASSDDGSAGVARSLGARVLEVPNRGLGFLYNEGARASTADYVLVANPDTAFEPGCAARLSAALEEDATRFAADPRQLDWSGTRTIHARTLVRPGSLREPIPGLGVDPLAAANTVVTTASANAGAMLVRRSMLLELGGFDEEFFLEYEDLDLCWRAWMRGWSSVYVPDAVLRHRVGGATGEADAPRRLAASHSSVVRFAAKCLPPDRLAFALVGEALRALRHPRAIGRAFAALPAALRARRSLGGDRRAVHRRLVALADER